MKFYSVGISLMIGGTIGNLIDRVFRGYVIDFLDFDIFGYSYPTFNVADMALVIGVIMFAIDILFLETRRNKRND
jgi:signal peptidase II